MVILYFQQCLTFFLNDFISDISSLSLSIPVTELNISVLRTVCLEMIGL